ncbi:hypothetical protein [Sphingomonas sp.]|uniref:hypothetical protein n=1 Tax=Sphingomonas sp. TaxID=28214 RepID=UPI003CC598D1
MIPATYLARWGHLASDGKDLAVPAHLAELALKRVGSGAKAAALKPEVDAAAREMLAHNAGRLAQLHGERQAAQSLAAGAQTVEQAKLVWSEVLSKASRVEMMLRLSKAREGNARLGQLEAALHHIMVSWPRATSAAEVEKFADQMSGILGEIRTISAAFDV